MENNELKVLANVGAIIVACSVAGALFGQAPTGFLLGCIASVFYWRKKDNESW